MDIVIKTENGRFNYRVCAVILNGNKILLERDERVPYYGLTGGKVMLHETAEHAVLRELKEELNIEAEIVRPLWLCQNFFTEDVNGDKYHELGVYFLIDVSKTELPKSGSFTLREGKQKHMLEWVEISRLKDLYFYPLFLKTEIFNLPKTFTLITEVK